MTGAQLLVRCLEREGVQYVFGVPGEETLDLNDALLDSAIRFVPVRHGQRAGIPVVTTFMAKGAIPWDHPLSVMTVGLASAGYERAGFAQADLVVAVGYDPVEYGPAQWNRSGQAQIVHLDFTAAEVDTYYQPAVEVVADVREALELLAPLVTVRTDRTPPHSPGADSRARADRFPLLPQRILADLQDALGPENLVVSDGFAAMGIGLPGAIAAKLASPTRRVVTVTGDGGLLMNVQELETARRLGLAFVVLIFRDDGYGVIRWKQQRRFGRTAGVDFGNPDFVALAEAFGCQGVRIESAAALRPVLDAALGAPVPVLIDCPVDYSENDRLIEP